jgi:hypothetical protein
VPSGRLSGGIVYLFGVRRGCDADRADSHIDARGEGPCWMNSRRGSTKSPVRLGEDVVGRRPASPSRTAASARICVEGRLPQLLVVHLARALNLPHLVMRLHDDRSIRVVTAICRSRKWALMDID